MVTVPKFDFFRGKDVSLYSTAAEKLSTFTPLVDGDFYCGPWFETSGFPSITIAALTDKASEGVLEFSPNASDVDEEITFDVAANTNFIRVYNLTRKFARVKLTNTSGSDQTFLRLQVILGYQDIAPVSTLSSGAAGFLVDVVNSITGTFKPQGFTVAQKTTPVTIGTSATILLSSPLSGRNSISIFNKSATGTIYVGADNTVTADDTATGGWEILPDETLNEPVSDSVDYYVIGSEPGILAKVRELA